MCTQIAPSREVLLGKVDLPKSATTPSATGFIPVVYGILHYADPTRH